MKKINYEILLGVALVLCASFSRLIPHPWNFTALGAVALFSGAVFRKTWLGLIVMLASMLISDLIIGFHGLVAWVYIPCLITLILGHLIGKENGSRFIAKSVILRNLVLVLSSSFLFFAISNFGVWFQGTSYTKDSAGFIECYVMALPFLKNQMAGDFFFSFVLFGSYQWALNYLQIRNAETAVTRTSK